ncbi:tRNA pseudouridine(54/55) synthase Pus10 [Halanaerobacter jeridensis]|uniref:tRNA pseudouridine(55) synthase n=1 Tax=Halanaerobacter jeridensis TaxID=706427 RepID=A0A939BNW9_9FIRM|nr:tRNA pseudouridine(54/55) synthase Pus10 [Halanaerobacter jeridensis]MBM7555938.1 tRNA pseudouridine synthase 10 [Halanaerobacter jeridensis]
MDLEYQRQELLAEDLCNHCLGRQFAQLGSGLENYERGYLLRNINDLSQESFKRDNLAGNLSVGGECYLCQGLFNELNKYTKLMIDRLEEYQFNTILVGTRPPESVKKKEKELWEDYGKQYAEPLKTEFNRLLAKRIMRRLNVDSDLERPDIQAVVDIPSDEVELYLSSVLVYGQYNKYVRDISQTIWNYSENSVQQVLQTPFLNEFDAVETKFHGAGREDLNVRCFAKREFILELMEPKRRTVDLEKLTTVVNQSQDQVEIFNLKFVTPDKKEVIKNRKADKTYKAIVHIDDDLSANDVLELEKLKGLVEQETPSRVLKNRGDRLRKREIYQVLAEVITSHKIELIIKTEAGAYIKELISGDNGRTQPSVAELLDCQAECERLDVISIDN